MSTVKAVEAMRLDRAAGTLLGAAVGDAVGVPYEFGTRSMDPDPDMYGGDLGT